MYRHTSLISLLVLCAGCLPPHPTPAQREAYEQERLIRSIEEDRAAEAKRVMQARDACAAWPADPERALDFASKLESAYENGIVASGLLDGPALLAEASSYIAQAASAASHWEGKLYDQKAMLLMASGDREGGYRLLEQTMQKTPVLEDFPVLLHWYDEQGRRDDIIALCRHVRPLAHGFEKRYWMLGYCMHYLHTEDVAVGLAWANEDDRAFYEKQREIYRVRSDAWAAAARRGASQEELQALTDAAAAEDAARRAEESAAIAGPAGVSVTFRSRCATMVRVCFGENPKLHCDITAPISGNSITSYTFEPGDMIWVVDAQNNGLASASISASTSEVEIASSCTGLSAR